MSEQLRVAVIGLGPVGYAIAGSLKREGLKVVGCDLSANIRQRFHDEGRLIALTPAEAAVGCDIVICAVADADQTETVLFGADGCAQAMPRGAVFVCCVTLDDETSAGLAARLEATGRHYLDAPVSSEPGAGRLTMIVSGSEAAFDEARPALDILATAAPGG